MKNRYINIREAARICCCSMDTLRNYEKKLLIKPLRIGPRKDRRYSKADILLILGLKRKYTKRVK